MRILKTVGSVAVALVAGAAVALLLTGRLRLDWSGKFAATSPDGHGEHAEHEEGASHVVGGKIVLDAESLAAARIRTAPAALGSVAMTLPLTGEVQIATDRAAHVTPRIPGTLHEVLKTVGERVTAGEPLCTIESVELGQARADHVSAESELTLTERNFRRWQELFEKGLRTQNELWTAENEFTRAKIRHDAAMGKLKALGTDDEHEIAALNTSSLSNRYAVKSPITGVLLERHATLGENVEGKDVLFLAADLSEVWIQAAVYEKDLSLVRSGMAATLVTQAYPDLRFRGAVAYVGEIVEEKSRTVPVRITVRNGPAPGSGARFALRPGMFTTVDLEVSRHDEVLVVPHSAIQTINDQSVVFVRVPLPSSKEAPAKPGDAKHEPDEHGHGHAEKGAHEHAAGGGAAFEKRVVTLGLRDAEHVEVLTGVQWGDEVVVENAFLLKSELQKSQIGEGHAH